jgi:2-methylcitrate dehydratase
VDATTASIVSFAESLTFDGLPEAARIAVKTRVLDTYACAWGGIDSPPAAAAKRAFVDPAQSGRAHLVTGELVGLEPAAFVNSLMCRYLDFNDAHEVAYGHPSDMILPLFNVAEYSGANGRDVLTAIAAAYQVACGITLAGGVHYARWETAFAQGMGTAVGAAMMLKLSPAAIADAVGIAVACSTPLNIRKTGSRLSMWKGAAGPQASKVGIQAALLAQVGMEGPHEAFEGARGVFEKVTGEFDLTPYMSSLDRYQIEETTIKLLPVSGRVLGPTLQTIEMRPDVGDYRQIEKIDIETYNYCYEFEQKDHASLAEGEAWRPGTRETADHSLRWLMAVALIDGDVTQASFEPERLERTDVRELITNMTITEEPEFTKRWPDEWINRITMHMRDGRTVERQTGFPVGNPKNPASPAALRNKVASLVTPHLGDGAVDSLVDGVARLEDWDRAGLLFEGAADGWKAIGR